MCDLHKSFRKFMMALPDLYSHQEPQGYSSNLFPKTSYDTLEILSG